MAPVTISPADLAPFATIDEAKALAMIADALAMAKLIAPCIADQEFAHPDAAKAIVRGAILRWNESGAGGRSQVTDVVGPFSHSEAYQQPSRRTLFWPSEIDQLKKLCAGSKGKAWGYDTAPSIGSGHSETCDLNLGGTSCSCGAVIAGFPLWEGGQP